MAKRAGNYNQVSKAIETLTPYRHSNAKGDWTDVGRIRDGHYKVYSRIYGNEVLMLDITISPKRVNAINFTYYDTPSAVRLSKIIKSLYT